MIDRAAWVALVLASILFALPAWAQSPPPPSGGCINGTEPACGPPPPPPQPEWYLQRKCPAVADCMPGWDKERAERCAWVKAHCPDTQIVY
ncbi:MAG: hypothetical protein KGJ66_04415 [Alphaproteobacteria bacterium]|nr:hypothetical protein [Alphaproteobacteria bacterium]